MSRKVQSERRLIIGKECIIWEWSCAMVCIGGFSCWISGADYIRLVSFIGFAAQTYSLPVEWTVGDELLRHTLGAVRFINPSFFKALADN